MIFSPNDTCATLRANISGNVMARRGLLSLLLLATPLAGAAQEPPLPAGLEEPAPNRDSKDDPALPSGLKPSEPALPSGLGEKPPSEKPDQRKEKAPSPLTENLTGFIDARIGVRLQDDLNQGAVTIGETRLRLENTWEPGPLAIRLVGDAVFDPVLDEYKPRLETGEGAFDLREANVVWRPFSFADLKVGRQVLTWGVGDLVFINDLFPKDYNSFFIGRDDEYLKAPSDAVRLSLFADLANLDLVYTPRFDADRFIDGKRLSYFNPLAGGVVGENLELDPIRPDRWFQDDEFAARLYRQAGAFEIAAYGYIGYFKSPAGVTPFGDFYFPKLAAYGASLRGPFQGGILTGEFGRHISRDDKNGTNPFAPNSDMRVLIGFEKEVAADLTASFQYYAQVRSNQDAYVAGLAPGAQPPERTRHMLTLRLTKLAMNQNLTLSLFNFWSPNVSDGHMRLRASYKLSDDWLVEGGGNFFYGPREDALFSQLNDNTNIYFAARRSF